MSGVLTNLTNAVTNALVPVARQALTTRGFASSLTPVWIRRNRSIGSIIPDVAIEENHTDRVQITQHPVAQGSPVADHAFKQPMMLTMRCGWTDAGHQPGRIKDVYASLCELMGTDKKAIGVLDISTGKRNYQNMVLTELTTRTSTETENAMIVEMQFTEVIRVQTKSTQQPKSSLLEDAAKTQNQSETTPKQGEEKPEGGPGITFMRGTADAIGIGGKPYYDTPIPPIPPTTIPPVPTPKLLA